MAHASEPSGRLERLEAQARSSPGQEPPPVEPTVHGPAVVAEGSGRVEADPRSGGDDARVAPGIEEALAALRPQLYRIAMRLTRSSEASEDLVQDTLERALRHQHQFQPGSNLRAWVGKILHNLFIDHCKNKARQPITVPVDERIATIDSAEEPPAWAAVSAEQLDDALVELTPTLRKVFELRMHENASYDDIASRLRIPRATVATRLRRARMQLRERLLSKAVMVQERR